MPRFEKAQNGDAVLTIARELIEDHYDDLKELRKGGAGKVALSIDFVFVFADPDEDGKPKGAALKLHGTPAAAIVKPCGLKDRSLGRGDVEIRIDGNRWNGYEGKPGFYQGVDPWTDEQKAALVDHELHHLIVKRDGDNAVMRDHLGRALFRLRPHDHQFGWFNAIAARHGVHSFEVQQATEIVKTTGQIYFDFAENPSLLAHA